MVKTRSSTSNLSKNKNVPENKSNIAQLLENVNTTTSNRLSKRNSRSNNLLNSPQVKVEETNNKHLLRIEPKKKRNMITAQQIEELIQYIENDDLTVLDASRKAKIHYKSALKYYHKYKNDPEKNPPVPRYYISNASQSPSSSLPNGTRDSSLQGQKPTIKSHKENWVTQEQIKNLIHYIEDQKMTIRAASLRANLGPVTGYKYYYMYQEDGKIPQPRSQNPTRLSRYTSDQIKSLIHYVENENMTITAASKKAMMSFTTSWRYYRKYQKTGKIPLLSNNNDTRCSFEQKKMLIDFLFNEKMTLKEASINAGVSERCGIAFYANQFVEGDRCIPEELKGLIGPYTHEQIKELIGYLIDDKLSVQVALHKVNTVED
ncbi:hypothetical protein K501DRAFT_328515 [Backusella circina FSU 941]|nr:hypothetical protein K501DRAFT_328515 [Backusella circina FSU 941]